MKFTTALLALAAPFMVAASAAAPPPDSGAARMSKLMALKTDAHERQRGRGFFSPGKWKNKKKTYEKCKNGKAGEYSCDNVDMAGFLSHEALGSTTREGNDVWGWSSPDGREFGAVGQTDGTAFVEILKNGELKYMGRLPTQTVSSIWRDMKVIDGYCYIGSEAAGHGLQVFDMRKLLKLKSPKTFDIATDLTAWHKGFGSSHNIVAHEQTKTIFAVGTTRSGPCKAGLYMLDVQNPAKPTYAGCASEDGYVHDAQCVIYSGPDAQYTGKEICFGYNEDSLTVYDVTDRKAPKVISSTPYTGSQYTHQGWIIDPVGQTFLLLDDELDEQESSGEAADQRTTTYIWNITSLATPVKTGIYKSPVKSIDHNQYVIDGISWQSNYASGLRVVDVSKFEEDPTGASFEQIAYFDCYPEDDASPEAEFYGAWSVYPYFKSGYVLLNSIERGIFSLKPTFQKPGKPGQGKDRGD